MTAEPVHVHSKEKKDKMIYVLVALIPILIIGYLVYANFIASHEFVYFYDIGTGSESYLSPVNRVSSPVLEGSYRNMTSQLVYFSVPIARGAESVTVETRYLPVFPKDTKFSLGAKNAQNWSYLWQPLPSDFGNSSDREWIVANVTFDLGNLTVQNGRLSLVFNAPHLQESKNPELQISVDWINTIVYKPGLGGSE